MQEKIIDISDYKPHWIIQAENKIHIIPDEIFNKIISKKMDIEELEDWKEILLTIIKEWHDENIQTSK